MIPGIKRISIHASGQELSDASHCFCLTLRTGIICRITLPPCLFVQPIAAHDFTIYLFDTHTSFYATFEESWCVKLVELLLLHITVFTTTFKEGQTIKAYPRSDEILTVWYFLIDFQFG